MTGEPVAEVKNERSHSSKSGATISGRKTRGKSTCRAIKGTVK